MQFLSLGSIYLHLSCILPHSPQLNALKLQKQKKMFPAIILRNRKRGLLTKSPKKRKAIGSKLSLFEEDQAQIQKGKKLFELKLRRLGTPRDDYVVPQSGGVFEPEYPVRKTTLCCICSTVGFAYCLWVAYFIVWYIWVNLLFSALDFARLSVLSIVFQCGS